MWVQPTPANHHEASKEPHNLVAKVRDFSVNHQKHSAAEKNSSKPAVSPEEKAAAKINAEVKQAKAKIAEEKEQKAK